VTHGSVSASKHEEFDRHESTRNQKLHTCAPINRGEPLITVGGYTYDQAGSKLPSERPGTSSCALKHLCCLCGCFSSLYCRTTYNTEACEYTDTQCLASSTRIQKTCAKEYTFPRKQRTASVAETMALSSTL